MTADHFKPEALRGLAKIQRLVNRQAARQRHPAVWMNTHGQCMAWLHGFASDLVGPLDPLIVWEAIAYGVRQTLSAIADAEARRIDWHPTLAGDNLTAHTMHRWQYNFETVTGYKPAAA